MQGHGKVGVDGGEVGQPQGFHPGSQVGPDTLIENTSQVVKHSSPSRWQRAEQEKATASVLEQRAGGPEQGSPSQKA